MFANPMPVSLTPRGEFPESADSCLSRGPYVKMLSFQSGFVP